MAAEGAGESVQGFDYDHDTHGRREVVRPHLPDDGPLPAEQPPGWKYGYNERGEVEVADRFRPEAASVEDGIVGHQRRSYAYDLMGNRDTATQGTAAAELRQTGYSANILQQYDGLTHSRSVEITGQAVAGATVELKLDAGTPLTVDRTLPQHQTGDPHSFRYVHAVAGTEARWLHVQIKASAGGINLTRQGYVYIPPASETVVHDDDGNLTEDAQWEYTWDAENRMTSATQKSLPVAAGVSTPPPARKKLTFAYDYRNRRIAKQVFQLEPSAASQTAAGSPEGSAANQTLNLEPETSTWRLVKDLRFVHDGYQMIAELDHTFATSTGLEGSRVTRTFLWGPDVSGTMSGAGGVGGLLSTTYQGVTYQVCSDANGNVTGLVPTSGPGAGQLVARFDYDPFGNRITNTGPDVDLCPFGFSAKYTDSETGIVHFDLRDYIPQHARWMSPDRIGERGGINLYGMCGNDAVNHWDYLGQYTNAESAWCKKNKRCCLFSAGGEDIISNKLAKLFGKYNPWGITRMGTEASVVNAVQHCAWMCFVANRPCCDKQKALELGEAHEQKPNNDERDKQMDLFNNNVGASMVVPYTPWTWQDPSSVQADKCILKCIEKARAKQLIWLNTTYDITGNERTGNLPSGINPSIPPQQ